MTRQAIADVAVDWQVQLAPGSDPQAATAELGRSPGFTSLAQVGYADTPGLETSTGSTVQTTGPGKVLGLDPAYRTAFPAEIRELIGQGSVLLAQQTAANLHAAPGSVVTVQRPGLDPVPVTVSGVVDLPLADALFQAIGAPAGAAPVAPPDNVLLLPLDQWHALFDPVASVAPDAVRLQLHAALPHDLPADPNAAYTEVTGAARNYETRLAGTGIVGDNLAARLDVARSDALLRAGALPLPGVAWCAPGRDSDRGDCRRRRHDPPPRPGPAAATRRRAAPDHESRRGRNDPRRSGRQSPRTGDRRAGGAG